MKRTRITISLSPKSEDAATVMRALKTAPHWKRSAELVRWAAAYLNGESLAKQAETIPELDMTDEEVDAILDEW